MLSSMLSSVFYGIPLPSIISSRSKYTVLKFYRIKSSVKIFYFHPPPPPPEASAEFYFDVSKQYFERIPWTLDNNSNTNNGGTSLVTTAK